jgi:serine protease Do
MQIIKRFSYVALAGAFLLLACTESSARPKNNEAPVVFGAVNPPIESPKQSDFTELRYAIAEMVEKVVPAVVSLKIDQRVAAQRNFRSPFEEFFFGPFGFPPQQRPEQERRQQSLGSGVIISTNGYIVTNNHVIENAQNIVVTLHDGREFDAEVVGTDQDSDLALIRLKNTEVVLQPAYLGNSDSLRVGEWVVAIGNPFGLSHTVTSGIVSAKDIHNRGLNAYENFIQTDAAINPGNSGGALFNLQGELVGINTAILSRSGGFMGIGFAIPINMARRISEELVSTGRVERGWLGVSIQDLNQKLAENFNLKSTAGALVTEVMEETPAAKAGLQPGDLILKLENQTVRNVNELRHRIALIKPGTQVELEILRGEKKQKLKLVVGSRSDEVAASSSEATKRKSLGMEVSNIDAEWERRLNLASNQGVVVTNVEQGTPAARADLRVGDVIIQMNRREVRNIRDYSAIVKDAGNKPVLLLVLRGRGRMFVVVQPE